MLGLQQPLSDGGSNKNRLESIRRKLNVKEMKMSEEAEDYIKQSDRRGLIQIIQDASQPSEINFLDNSVPTNEIDEPWADDTRFKLVSLRIETTSYNKYFDRQL